MPDTTNADRSQRRRYDELLEQCRDTVLVFCDAQLLELFQNVNAALLDFAERAESNAVQSRFFDAMSQLNRRRADIEHLFRSEVNLGFDQLGRTAAAPGPAPTIDGLELTLMEPDEIEESVASENLVLRANARYFPELYALSQRLGALVGGAKLKDHEIPAGPHHLVRSFRRSLEGLDVEVRVKLILYVLFDKYVLKNARTTYDEYNALLIGAGILPNLKPMPIRADRSAKAAARQTAAASRSDSASEHQSLGAELFDSILDLLSMREGASGGGRAGRSPTPQEAQAQTKELLSALSSLQASQTPEQVADTVSEATRYPNIEIDTAFISRVKDALGQERQQILSRVDKDKLSPMDADLIDLIGMLFEYMLNDPILPNVAKALLSHLHTPYLKVALIDRRLLVDNRHPARRLLDRLVEAGSLWVEEGNPGRGMFPAMQAIVARVLQELAEDVALFDELLVELDEKMKEQQRRSDTMEQRTQEAARGREKLTLAKQRAAREIQRLLERHSVPVAVDAFLSKVWIDHLVFILLRDEEQERGNTWKHAVGVAEQLIALFDPQSAAEPSHVRLTAIARLRNDIAVTAQRMSGFNNATVEALLTLLDAPQDWPRQALDTAPRAAAVEPPPILGTPTADSDDLTEPQRDMIERLRKMRYGTWFELGEGPGSPARRIKLSWMSPLTSTCMFVDRSGMQAEIKGLKDLAQELLDGRARVVSRPKHPFIDRALLAIRRMLQGDDGNHAATAPP